MRTGSSVRSVGSVASDLAEIFCCTSTSSRALGLFVGFLAWLLSLLARLLGLDHVDAHLAEHGEDVLDLLGIDLLGGQDRVDLVMGDVAALHGGADQLFDRGIGEIEQRAIRQGLTILLLGRPLLIDLAYHEALPGRR